MTLSSLAVALLVLDGHGPASPSPVARSTDLVLMFQVSLLALKLCLDNDLGRVIELLHNRSLRNL